MINQEENLHSEYKDSGIQRQSSLLRLERVSDGIFLLAMMLMVLQFDLPELNGGLSAVKIREFLIAQLPALYIYIGTFILICFYWLSNLHQFKHFKKTDTVHTWITLLSLMFVVIIPYTNDLASVYPLNSDVQIFYSINLTLVGVLSCLGWWYGSSNYRLVSQSLDRQEARYILIESSIEPILCILSIGVSLYSQNYWEWTFFLIVPASFLLSKWNSRKQTIPS